MSDIEELRARAERSTAALRYAPAVGPLETIMMTPESAKRLADLIDALLAVVTLTRDDVRLLRVALLNYIPPPSDRDRAVGLIAKLEEMEKKK